MRGGGGGGGGGGGAQEQAGQGLGEGQARGGGGGGLRVVGPLGGQRGQGGGGGGRGQGLLPGGPAGQGLGGGQVPPPPLLQPVSVEVLQNLASLMRCLLLVALRKLAQSSSQRQQGERRGMAVSSQALASGVPL